MKLNSTSSFLFLGFGGAGQRHLRILRELLPENPFYGYRFTKKTPLLNKDFSVNKEDNLEEKYQIKLLKNFQDISSITPLFTVIALPTSLHKEYCIFAKKLKSNVFVEKPGFFNKEEINELNNAFLNSQEKITVGYQRQFNPVVKSLKKIIDSNLYGGIKLINLEIASFIPDWHPYENYKNLYACRSDLGGGILHTECHELFLICSLFGTPNKVRKKFWNNNKGAINVFDSCSLILEYNEFKVEGTISFYKKPNKRIINFEMEKAILYLDLNNNKLILKEKKGEIIEENYDLDSHDLFMEQAKEFLKLNSNNQDILRNLNSLSKIIND